MIGEREKRGNRMGAVTGQQRVVWMERKGQRDGKGEKKRKGKEQWEIEENKGLKGRGQIKEERKEN